MNSQDKNKSANRGRRESLAQRLGDALDQMKPHGAEECPDADVTAAYAERALSPDESTRWEGHFAACARCRKILHVLDASAETPLAGKEVAQLGELVSAVQAPVEITRGSAGRARPRFVDWRVRWLAPALGVAAVLAVRFAMRPPWRATDRRVSETLVAQAPKEEAPLSPAPAEVNAPSRVAPQQDQKTQAAPPPDRSPAKAGSLNPHAEALAKGRAEFGTAMDRVSPSSGEAAGSLQEKKQLGAMQDGREVRSPAVPPPPPPPNPEASREAPAAPQSQAKAALGTPALAPLSQARAQANAAGPPAPEVPLSTSQSVTVTESTPRVETTDGTLGGAIQQEHSADRPINGRDFQALLNLRPAPEFLVSLKSPSGSILWRAGKGGLIDRSADAGKTWVSKLSPSQEDWLAGAAVSNAVCWLAGRNGAIARTIDGERWERVAPPAQSAGIDGKLPDWTGMTARDGRSATITASDGRKFATADGGKTWQQQ